MKIRKRREKKIIVLYLEGKININCANFIEETSILLNQDYLKLLCDFTNVDMVDYNGLSILAIAYKNVVNKNGVMKFCNVPIHIKKLFKLVRLDLVFDIYDDERAALKSFKTSSKIDKLYLRRRFKRLEFQLPIKYSLSNTAKSRVLSGKILNLSGEGLFIYTKHILPITSQISMQLKLDEDLKPIDLPGRIIWLADKELQPHCCPGMGVEFMHIDSENQKKIIDFIDKNITHRSKL